MIEPEMAFYDLNDNMDLAEQFITYVLKNVLEKCENDLAFLDDRFTKEENQKPKIERSPMGLLEKIKFVIENRQTSVWLYDWSHAEENASLWFYQM